MSSIKDMEFEKLVETTEQLCGKFSFQKMDKSVESYFVDVDNIHSLNHGIEKYDDINTPIAMKSVLENMWVASSDSQMREFVMILSVAAFKNRNTGEREDSEISPYIYEF